MSTHKLGTPKRREDFEQEKPPLGRKSRLAPFIHDIGELRNKGYSLQQVRQYLAQNNVDVSIRGLSDFIRRYKEQMTRSSPGSEPKPRTDCANTIETTGRAPQ